MFALGLSSCCAGWQLPRPASAGSCSITQAGAGHQDSSSSSSSHLHGIGDRPSPGWDMGPTWAQLGRAQGWAGFWRAGDRPCCGLTRQKLMAPRPARAVLWGLAISLHSLPAEMIPDSFFYLFVCLFYSHL